MENRIQKQIVDISSSAHDLVNQWKILGDESTKPLRNLSNFSVQLRHVKGARVEQLDQFESIKDALIFNICQRIEEELLELKRIIEKINQITRTFRTKLMSFEDSTLNLDWDSDSFVIHGNATQPSLSRFLENGQIFLNFFWNKLDRINKIHRELDVGDGEKIEELQECIRLIDRAGTNFSYFLALTQYIVR